jgi:iron complex transport system substrate-binding protein
MKTKNKLLAMLEIAIVLCSVFLVAIPAIAAEQTTQEVSATASEVTTTSEDDYVLGVYGNANEDDTIDMRDLTYVKLIFFGKKSVTELADAKYDGKINPLDFIQIKLIIVGKEKELTFVDTADRVVTVKKPVERIVVLNSDTAEAVRILDAVDKVVGVSTSVFKKSYYFPEMIKRTSIGKWNKPDYEAIIELNPDIVIGYVKWPPISEVEEKLEPVGITAIALDFYKQDMLRGEVEKLGYVLNKKESAEEYNEWCGKYEDEIKSLVDELKEEEKPKVFIETKYKGPGDIGSRGPGSADDILCTMAGGINIAGDLPKAYPHVEWEWVLNENPDVIIKCPYPPGWGWNTTEDLENEIEAIEERPGAERIMAVKNNRIYVSTYEFRYGMDSIAGLAHWSKLLHPEFDLDPEGIYREYVKQILNLEYPEDIIFVYPPLAS